MKKASYIVECNSSKVKYVLKIRLNELKNNEENIYKIIKKNMHDNIIKFKDYIIRDRYYFYLYEYVDGVDLYDYMKSGVILNDDDINKIFSQIVKAVGFLHSLNIIHCDLKLENIIITIPDKKIVVTDFDLSQLCYNNGIISNCTVGTKGYIAPESYDICVYSKKTDIWSLGIILYVLITRKLLYAVTDSNLYRRNEFRHQEFANVEKQICKLNYNNEYFEILKGTLVFEDYKRMSIKEIIKKIDH
jgi:serine/threonine protein kinase